ncbi:MAG: ectoine/hydroxyectoine ABC transporter permease subunit EhuC [Dehalobacterium sp.]
MSTLLTLLPPLLEGAKVTIQITFWGIILGFILAFVAGFARLSKYRLLRIVATVYVEVFRGTSLLVQLFWIYFVLPHFGLFLPTMLSAVLALGLNAGAYGSEVVRSSILNVSKGQIEASIALNMTPFQRMRLVILPQAFVMMLPGFGNLQIELLKGTSLVSLITLADMTYQGTILRAATFQTTEIYSLLLIMYFLLAWPLTRGIRWLENRLSIGRY